MILTKAFGNLRKQLLRHVGTKVGLSKSRVSDDTARARPFPTIKIFLLLGKKKKKRKMFVNSLDRTGAALLTYIRVSRLRNVPLKRENYLLARRIN